MRILSAVDLDLRLVRYFVAVAEHGHFGRAAAALHLAQPSLSRQVRRLEGQLSARLIDRGPQGSHLTEAGEVFLPLARALLRSAAQATASTRAAAEPSRLTIGYISGHFVTSAVREMRRQHPHAQVSTLHVEWNNPHAALLEHRVDVLVARLPFPTDELYVTVLYDEPRVLVVPLDHRLADWGSVVLADFADEPTPRFANDEWDAFWRLDPRPDGSPAPDGPVVEAVEDKFELTAAGQAVAIAPASFATSGLRRSDLTSIPIDDIAPCQMVLATRADERSRLVAAFNKIAVRHITSPDPIDPAAAS